MKCPVCKDVTLLMSEKNGVEIDYCPERRGIWLDRGELDKILDRAREGRAAETRADEARRSDDRHGHKRKSPVSALGDILEIFGGE